MRVLAASLLAASIIDPATVQNLLENYFYLGLLGVLVVASLGIPIPEDIPLIAAGVILKLHPESATWIGAFATAMVGIMSGDLVLYTVGRWWGKDVVNHSSVNWIITPARFTRACDSFRRWGVWFVFFGRFVMGVRAVMCLTAGATRYPYWRFFLADFAGAVICVPLFIGLGYVFAEHLRSLYQWLAEIQGALIGVVVLLVAGFLIYEYRRFTGERKADALAAEAAQASTPEVTASAEATIVRPTDAVRPADSVGPIAKNLRPGGAIAGVER